MDQSVEVRYHEEMGVSVPHGVYMFKSLLMLMLMTTQLLAGSGGSLYLCVSNDGYYCCIDTGPASCTCCHEQEEIPHDICCSDPACEEESAASCYERHEDEAPEPQLGLLAADPCGCTHIPVTLSADQPTTVARFSITTESERLALLLAWLPSLHVDDEVVPLTSPHFRRSDPSAGPAFALTVISTVVIRC